MRHTKQIKRGRRCRRPPKADFCWNKWSAAVWTVAIVVVERLIRIGPVPGKDKLPKRLQPEAKDKIHQIWMAPTKVDADQAFDLFVATYDAKYPKATECLSKDRDVLLTFYDFPAEHWIHLRTTNPIESTFATVRLRHRRTKGNGSRLACLTMVFKLMQSAEKRWRLLNGAKLLPDVIQGVTFIDGIKPQEAAA